MELSDALRSLYLIDGDPYLTMQAFNLAVVDPFIMDLEYQAMHKHFRDERTPGPEALFLSAQSQMWIFAAFELLRTFLQRTGEVVICAKNGGLKPKIEALERDQGYGHVGRDLRATQLREILQTPPVLDRIELDKRLVHIPYTRLKQLRVSLAKHEVMGKDGPIAFAPGYGRINQSCGSLDYQLERGRTILGTISLRDVADELRALTDRENAPTPEEIASFDRFMKLTDGDDFGTSDTGSHN